MMVINLYHKKNGSSLDDDECFVSQKTIINQWLKTTIFVAQKKNVNWMEENHYFCFTEKNNDSTDVSLDIDDHFCKLRKW